MTPEQIKALIAYANSLDHILLVKLKHGAYQVVRKIVSNEFSSYDIIINNGVCIKRLLSLYEWNDFLVGSLPQTLEPVQDVELSVDLDDYPLF